MQSVLKQSVDQQDYAPEEQSVAYEGCRALAFMYESRRAGADDGAESSCLKKSDLIHFPPPAEKRTLFPAGNILFDYIRYSQAME